MSITSPKTYAILPTAKGARFEFRGKQYQKTAMRMAQEEQGDNFKAFHGAIEVTIIGEPLLLSEAEAERWKPYHGHWADVRITRRRF